MKKTRKCSICKKPIPFNSGSFTWDSKTGYVHDACKENAKSKNKNKRMTEIDPEGLKQKG